MLLADAYNVIGARWCLARDRRDLDVPGLIAWIQRSPRFGKRRARVVCDGRPGPGWDRAQLLETSGGLIWTRVGATEVVFSGPGREADDVIEDVLARSRGIAILMVSSDRRLIRAAREARAEQMGNGAFLKALAADTAGLDRPDRPRFATEVPLNSASIAHWMRAFGFDPSGAARRGGPGDGSAPEPVRDEPAGPGRGRPPVASSEPGRDAPARADRLGERLNVALPPAPAPAQAPAQAATPIQAPLPPETAARAEAAGEGPELEALDPVLAEAFEEWRGRLDPDDLNMARWIDDVTPL